MARRGHDARTVAAVVLGVALTVAGCAMVVLGLPQRTAGQRLLLDTSSLPISLAVALLVVVVARRRGLFRRRLPWLARIGAGLVVLGVVAWLTVAFGLGWPGPVGAQVLLWLGLGAWVLWIAGTGSRGRVVRLEPGE